MQEMIMNGSISFGLALVLMFLAMLLLVVCSSCILLHSRRSQADKAGRKFDHVRNCTLSPALVSLHGMSNLGSLAHCNTYRSELSLRDRKSNCVSNQMLTTMGSKINLNGNLPNTPGSISNLMRGSAFTTSTNHSSQPMIATQRPPDVIEAPHSAARVGSAYPASAVNRVSDNDNGVAYADSDAVYYYSSSDALQSARPPLPSRNFPPPTVGHSRPAIEPRSFAQCNPTHSELARAKPALVTDNEYSVADDGAYNTGLPPPQLNGRALGRHEHSHNDVDNCSCSDYNAAYCSVGPEEHYIYQKVW
jgi:hypothetical protein